LLQIGPNCIFVATTRLGLSRLVPASRHPVYPWRFLSQEIAMPAELAPRTIHAYRRLAKPLAALMKAIRGKTTGAVGAGAVASCNRVIAAANIVFSREPDIGRMPLLPTNVPLSLLDLGVVVDELVLAATLFEQRHPEAESDED
jgi:hypothetical protein